MALNPNPIDARTGKHLAVAVRFSWGHPATLKVFQYVRWDRRERYTPGLVPPDGWTAAPELDIDTDKQDGGILDAAGRVKILRDRPPFDTLCRPYAHAPVTAELAEVDPWNWVDTYRVVHWGQVVLTTENKFKNRRLVEATVAGLKSRLNSPVGFACTPTCAHVLGDVNCGASLAPHTFLLPCGAISGRTFIVTGAPAPVPDYFQWGEAYYDGLSILIGEQAGSTLRAAFKQVPPEWSGKQIQLTAGCDKVPGPNGKCARVFANTHRIVALGIRMPAHMPLYENP